jgi:Zn-dependent protease
LKGSYSYGRLLAVALGKDQKRGSVELGNILGVPFRLHVSWFLIAALVSIGLAALYFPQNNAVWPAMTYWLAGVFTSTLLFASVLLHELGHAAVALREGVPVRSITLSIHGGVARMGGRPSTPGAELRIAAAGPLTSLALAGAFFLLSAVLSGGSTLNVSFALLGLANLVLAAFNMVPGFPLDGGRVLRALLVQRGDSLRDATQRASKAGQAAAVLFIASGITLSVIGSFAVGLALVLMGWYLMQASRLGRRQVWLEDMLTGVKARTVALEPVMAVPNDLRLNRLVEDYVLGRDQRFFMVMGGDSLLGLLTLREVKAIPSKDRGAFTAGQIMTPLAASAPADADDDLWALLLRMSAEEENQLPVADGDRLLGLLTRENLKRHIDLRSELAA